MNSRFRNDKRLTLKSAPVACFLTLAVFFSSAVIAADKPNIIIILADDLGYGDIQVYNEDSKIPTPSLNELASEGMRFTDMHSPSAVCTPTRYSLLTGRYAWRTHLKSGVLWGYSPLMISTERETIPSLLQKQGYHTAGIGKWHLGLGNGEADFFEPKVASDADGDNHFGGIKPGPNEVGFDHFFGIPASLDMKPYLYMENGKATKWLDGTLVESSAMRRSGGGGYWRRGQIAEDFDFHEVLPVLTDKAVGYIDERAKKKDEPFFLYFALTSPHTPWLPGEKFQGQSKAGYYGDFVVHTDHAVGQVLEALEKNEIAEDTLVIVTSDNGAHWLATDIEVTEFDRATDDGPDGVTLLPAFAGETSKTLEERAIIHHALDGMFAIRKGDWKLIEGVGSGGFTAPMRANVKDGMPVMQLYNLKEDPQEQENLVSKYPSKVAELLMDLNSIRED